MKKRIKTVEKQGFCEDSWSCGVTKNIQTGDRVFLLKQGKEPRGIVGSGVVTRGSMKTPIGIGRERAKKL
ncbi:MAG: hypothetical protein RML84_10625, partial [Anaerolineae bacterium]|nr:hypothetical protein [Anaerolineae bacterium]